MLGDKRFIHKLRLRNILSFGNDSETIELHSLNVIVGPNASGKSNFIETIGLLRQTSEDLVSPIREGGGTSEWLWKGLKKIPTGRIEATVDFPEGELPLRYILGFTVEGQRFQIVEEYIRNVNPQSPQYPPDFFYKYGSDNRTPNLLARIDESAPVGSTNGRNIMILSEKVFKPNQSILSQRKDPVQFPELTYLANHFPKIKL